MSRTSYQNVLALKDAAQTWNFDLFFPSIPGSSGSVQTMTYKCQSTSIPGSGVNIVGVELHGTKKQEAGNATYDHSFNAAFLETVDYETLSRFRLWRNFMRSWRDNTGTDSSQYKVNLEIDLYDNAGEIAETKILVGAFPTKINEVALDGAQANAIAITIEFSYDYVSDSASW